MILSAHQLSSGYPGREVIHGLDLTIRTGEITVIVGANASGKSTLLKTLARLIVPSSGEVRLDDVNAATFGRKEFARAVGLLPQDPIAPDGVQVADLVGRGRYPHQGLLGRWSSADDEAVARALELTGTADLADRHVTELSGGQRQRVWVAMVLAQDPAIMLLDEPTTFLDLANQIEVLEVLRRLNAARGTTIVMVLHDLNLAARYAHHLIVLKKGRVVIEGPPAILNPGIIADAFGLQATVIPDPVNSGPLVVPHSYPSQKEET